MKMKSLSLIQLLLGIVLPQAMAQTSTDIAFREQLEIQSHLRNEVLTVLRDVDPKASVSVEITVQTQIAPLPGSGLKPVETVNLGESNHLYPSVIQKTIVRINTALNPVPEWLRKRIGSVTQIGGKLPEIEFSPLSDEENLFFTSQSKTALEQEKVNKEMSVAQPLPEVGERENLPKSFQSYLNAFFLLGLAGLVFFAFMFQSTRTSIQRVIEDKILPVFKIQEKLALREPTLALDTSPGRPLQAQENALKELSIHSFVALLTDCYWCQEDRYAHWLWSNASGDLRAQAAATKRLETHYLRFILKEAPEELSYHLDPYYLKPLPVEHLSQADLASWLQKAPRYLRWISPIRAKNLPFSLTERLILESKVKSNRLPEAPLIPDKLSRPRPIPVQIQLGDLSLEDEVYLFESKPSLDPSVQASLKTLVWLALAPDHLQTKILAKKDATDLARAWIGPKEVLDCLASHLPPKKKELVLSYLDQIKPNRKNDAFISLVKEGLSAHQTQLKEAA